MSTISEGAACPDFALPDDRGETVTRDALAGRPFVLYFYPKDDTSGCTQEAIDFTKLAPDFSGLAIPVFGVSPDPVKKHGKFRDKHELAVRLLSDEDKVLLSAFGVWVEKSMYGRSYMGVERTTALVGADGRIVRLWPKVKVPGHAEEVLAAARDLPKAA
jgi:peroxiredoxin Q/BCP